MSYADTVIEMARREVIHRYHHLICPWRFTLPEHFQRAAVLDAWLRQKKLMEQQAGFYSTSSVTLDG